MFESKHWGIKGIVDALFRCEIMNENGEIKVIYLKFFFKFIYI